MLTDREKFVQALASPAVQDCFNCKYKETVNGDAKPCWRSKKWVAIKAPEFFCRSGPPEFGKEDKVEVPFPVREMWVWDGVHYNRPTE